MQQKLYKLFKIMRLRKSKDNSLEFKKKMEKDIHAFKFKKFIEYFIEHLDEPEESSSVHDTDEEQESGDESSNEEEVEKEDKLFKMQSSSFLADTLNLIQAPKKEEGVSSSIANEFESMFATSKGGHSNLKKWKRNDPKAASSSEDEDDREYLGHQEKKLSKEEEAQRQIRMREQFQEYNKEHNREMSLFEQHKQNKTSHAKGGKPKIRKEFDRNKDLMVFDSRSKMGDSQGLEKKFGKQGKFL